MPNTIYVCVPPTDGQIIELFDELARVLSTTVTLAIGGVSNLGRESSAIKALERTAHYDLSGANLGSHGLGIRLTRNSTAAVTVGQTEGHAFYTSIVLSTPEQYNQQGFSPELAVKTALRISAFLRENGLLPVQRGNGAAGSEPQEVLSALQNAARDQIVRTDDFFRDLQERFLAQQKTLNDEHVARQMALEEEYQKRNEELQAEMKRLDETRRELDDRSNTHARRELRKDLAKIASERQKSFTLSPETNRLRVPIHAVFVLTLTATFIGAAWSLYVWGRVGSTTWDAVTISSTIKTVFFTFSFATISGLYITWMNRWFDRHAEAQFQTKQFEIDINRATWAVEAALEWKTAQGEQMPATLLEGISRHLFDARTAESVEYSPLEMLASSILGSAANLKLDVGGAKVDLDRKSLKQISADAPKPAA